MTKKKQVSLWKHELEEVLESKVTEFHLLDYSKATKEDIWDCLSEKVWKGNPDKPLYEVVQDILHLKPSLFMTYLTQQSLMDDDLEESLHALLGTQKSD
ncbi:post-transcriptional regulator [Gracilibacillus sp. S3-1-1]|uniref:Post-transcriptional regulator n=1 Tax=Gracilibacillus pellucidus TaxID=3095368 RepID=A0ACC6MA37_9BACI|nr:post-transcriptional regulator [Gracilibacillus sp. S3-1-1]MDX8047682.1 post-transcriptional regulator [Gracilibacillus sp. S3-1-1]